MTFFVLMLIVFIGVYYVSKTINLKKFFKTIKETVKNLKTAWETCDK
ncbi:MAG: hypothetical protein BWY04_00697 [candidate division CPR1 bacterium ADurb.Bin160]|uniref:Uncharacterized protein n=1 Tax=candidate division CPR1 bacterium ADurb.Bin160 TaxID=1852826 RepID=A0A1V5ZNN6_9BACT|nr:MAG: hypothetical protein BWY04_00697 [candidate division CPR1 bacterium ADurb.Bin160]